MMRDTRALATPREFAEFVGRSEQWAATARYLGTGPSFCKIGRRVMYRWSDIDAWLDANTKTRTDDVA